VKADATNHPISWFKREADAESLDLSPSFQRRPVWDEQQASYLIDSILNDYPIPEVYIRLEVDSAGNQVHSVIDGQQRIRSILTFAENDLILSGDDVGADLLGLSFEDLTDAQKSAFWTYKIVVRELGQSSDPEIKDLFRRVNLNSVVLNDQELRHAEYEGRFIQVTEDLADDSWWVERHVFTVKEIRRMQDVEFISELLIGLMAGPQDKKLSIDDFYENYDAEFPDENAWRRLFKSTREVIDDLFDEGIGLWRSKSEFYSLFLVVGDLIYAGKRFNSKKISQVATALKDFRDEVDQAKRRSNTVRFNTDVHEYADAVTRAATDLSRRIARDRILRELIESAM
jgi:hypothetical protein